MFKLVTKLLLSKVSLKWNMFLKNYSYFYLKNILGTCLLQEIPYYESRI